MFLEELAEETLVGKVHGQRYLLDAHGTVFQKYAKFGHDVVVYPLVRASLAHRLDGLRQIFRRYAHLLGIPADAPFHTEVLLYEFDERCEDRLRACLLACALHLYSVYDVTHIVYERLYQCAYQLLAEVVAGFVSLPFYQREIFFYDVYLAFIESEHRMGAREKEQLRKFVNVAYRLAEEVIRHHDGYSGAVAAQHIVAHHLAFAHYYDIVLGDGALLCVYGIARLALGAECHKEAVHACRLRW